MAKHPKPKRRLGRRLRNWAFGMGLLFLAAGVATTGNSKSDGAWQDWAEDQVNAVPALTAPASPGRPPPGFNQDQIKNATIIVDVGHRLRLSKRAYVIAVATAMQESGLRNYYAVTYPETMHAPGAVKPPYQDYDSVGLFQQRPASGWGKPLELMNPQTAAAKFYRKLRSISGWDRMSLTDAAQRVQRSGYPYAYAKHEARAQALVNYICGNRC